MRFRCFGMILSCSIRAQLFSLQCFLIMLFTSFTFSVRTSLSFRATRVDNVTLVSGWLFLMDLPMSMISSAQAGESVDLRLFVPTCSIISSGPLRSSGLT